MSIQEHACFSIACDICRETLDDDGGTEHFDSAADAREDAKEYDWYVTDAVAICWECLAEDHAPIGDGERCERCNALAGDELVHPAVSS